MKIKPENLRAANSVIQLKDTSPSASKKNYWNGVHYITTKDNDLLIQTQDGQIWIDWYIPLEGESKELEVIVPAANLDSAARYLHGGSLDLVYDAGYLTLEKGRMHYRIRCDSKRTYPGPVIKGDAVSWEAPSNLYARALKFTGPFIDETNPSLDKSGATFYHDKGFIVAGSSKRISLAKGLTGLKNLSFKTKAAKVISEFLSSIGDTVKITVTESHYRFEDPVNKHSLTITAEAASFPAMTAPDSSRIREVVRIDRKKLLTLTKAFAGVLPEGSDRLNLTFKGIDEHSSLRVHTPGSQESEITDDEFGIYREIVDKIPQDVVRGQTGPTHIDLDRNNPPTVDIALSRSFLEATLDQMEGTTVKWTYYGRNVLVEDTETTTEGSEERPSLLKSICMVIQTVREANDIEKKASEKVVKDEEEAKSKVEAAPATPAAVEVPSSTPSSEKKTEVEKESEVKN